MSDSDDPPQRPEVVRNPYRQWPPIADVLAYNLRIRLAQLNWSQKDLSDASRVTRKQISSMTRGEGNPQLQTLEAIAKTLDVNVHELLTPPNLRK